MGDGEERLEDIVSDFSEKLQEDVYLDFSEEELSTARKDFEGTLVVKVFGGRRMKRNVFIPTFRRLWGQKGSVTFLEVEDDIVVASFTKEEDKERVLQFGPWLHLGSPVLVAKWEPGKQLKDLFIERPLQMVVQIHELPLEMRTEGMTGRCAEVAGLVLECIKPYQNSTANITRRKFFKFKVEVDLRKPLVPGCFLGLEDDPPKAKFRYESLPNFCFQCGLFDHDVTQCANQSRNALIAYDKSIRTEFLIEETLVAEIGVDSDTRLAGGKLGDL